MIYLFQPKKDLEHTIWQPFEENCKLVGEANPPNDACNKHCRMMMMIMLQVVPEFPRAPSDAGVDDGDVRASSVETARLIQTRLHQETAAGRRRASLPHQAAQPPAATCSGTGQLAVSTRPCTTALLCTHRASLHLRCSLAGDN